MDSPKRFETGLKQARKAAISAGPTFIWNVVGSPKRSETGLKLSETVGKQLYLLVLHLNGK